MRSTSLTAPLSLRPAFPRSSDCFPNFLNFSQVIRLLFKLFPGHQIAFQTFPRSSDCFPNFSNFSQVIRLLFKLWTRSCCQNPPKKIGSSHIDVQFPLVTISFHWLCTTHFFPAPTITVPVPESNYFSLYSTAHVSELHASRCAKFQPLHSCQWLWLCQIPNSGSGCAIVQSLDRICTLACLLLSHSPPTPWPPTFVHHPQCSLLWITISLSLELFCSGHRRSL